MDGAGATAYFRGMAEKMRFEGLTLTVASVERSLEFYGGKLGLTVEMKALPAFAMIRIGDLQLARITLLAAVITYAVAALVLQIAVVVAYGLTPERQRHQVLNKVHNLLARYAISALICKAATEADVDPDRVKFKRTVRLVRRRVADPAFPP